MPREANAVADSSQTPFPNENLTTAHAINGTAETAKKELKFD